MISFIIIGRNEGWKLTKCFENVFKTIEENNLTDSEVIYVDSQSTDDSIARAKKFSEIKIFQITSKCNAAIGRNIGAKEAKFDYLCFLDGDMEVNPQFSPFQNINDNNFNEELFSGRLHNIYYNDNDEIIDEYTEKSNDKPYYKPITGGSFIIKKSIWDLYCGMDNRMIRGADPELGLRLYQKGILLNMYPEVFVKHHTLKMKNKFPLNAQKILAVTVLMYRSKLLNKLIIKQFLLSSKYTLLFLSLCIITTIFGHIIYMGIFFILCFIIAIFKKVNPIKYTLHHTYRVFLTFFGFFLYYPTKINTDEITYDEL